ncbi:FAS-associated factor 1 isoform X3 [Hylaeus anthracinus]|uniref:FAS-associated factor 1 isoform X3 n=1 Tax=Hylaeus volcanicus TaxID=313075 RepID=UPI0023B82B83|nr:FAS-associated factor 1 isoform X3 [Hylaeus volcanicus]XP_054005445.1 FAS-associated factor 1 isoform X3 [Hylaeus anthracinus]
MAGTRDEILADFQACTGIDDVADAIKYLEASNWELLAAVNQAIPRGTQQLPSEMSPDIEMIEEIERMPHSSSSMSQTVHESKSNLKMDVVENSKPGTSKPKNCAKGRTLTFRINYLNNLYTINLSEFSSLRDLKQLIWEQTHVPPCQQRFHGWTKGLESPSTSLHTLDLPKDYTISMSSRAEDPDITTDNLADHMKQTYTLNIKDEIRKKTYNLKYSGTNTILDVKSEHDLSVTELPMKQEKKDVIDLVGSDSSENEGDDVEDSESFNVDDDIFIDFKSTKIQRLMPENMIDETMGTLHFAEEFEKRYGQAHPEFFTGKFKDAVKESCLKPAKERKLLAVYLHHDNSVLANVFCTQLLGSETVLQVLSANFIVWGWDITYESNKQRFLLSVKQTLGSVAALAMKNIDVDTLPVLVVIMRTRSNTEIFTTVHGNVGVNELLTNLIHAVEVFQEQRRADIGVEEERQARERVKQEQDRAYQESLAADRAKEKAKEQKKVEEELEKRKKLEAENERLAEEAKKEAHRQAIESSLPPEPQQGAGDGVLKVRVRLPAGEFLERRFQSDTPLQTLLNFLIVEGYPTEEYKVLCSWPRRDLTSMDSKLTLMDLKFCPQETVILEER